MKTSAPALYRMKSVRNTLLGAAFAVFLVPTTHAQTPLPIYEPFPLSYTNGAPDETVAVPAGSATTYPARRVRNAPTTAVWQIGGSAGGGSTLAVGGPAALSYPGLYQAGPSGGAYIRTNLTTGNRSAGILFPTNSAGQLYASFLIKVVQPPAATGGSTNSRCVVKIDNTSVGTGVNGGAGTAVGVFVTPESRLAISKSSTTVPGITNDTVLTAGTHLVVVRYTWNPGVDDDEFDLWLDPGSLNALPGNEPAPSVTLTTGTDIPSFSSLFMQAPQGGPPQVPAEFFLDEFRIATNWFEVTPTQALCTAASIVTPPSDSAVYEGISGSFSVVAAGTSPTFQWQLSADGGGTWNNISNATSQTYLTPPTTLADNSKMYRAIASVACSSTSVTSAPATLTITAATITPNGVIMNDVFADGQYNNIPVAPDNSVWLQSTAGTLDASSGTEMVATSSSNAVVWLGFFTDDSVTNQPVHLDIGRALKATLVFKANNIVTNGGNFRIGLFDFADGGTRPTADGTGVANSGANVRGYMATINYGTNFTGNPFSLYARNNLLADLMGTTANFLNLGGGPAGYSNAPAFMNGVNYTAQFLLTRRTANLVDFTVTFTGGGTNWAYLNDDILYCYPRFDAIAIRSGSAALAADSFEISNFKVEVLPAAPPIQIPLVLTLADTNNHNNVVLTWSSSSFALQSTTNLSMPFSNVAGATSPYTNATSSAGARFFRLFFPGN
jgi:hypothetical protein